jgi:hypothetical protein
MPRKLNPQTQCNHRSTVGRRCHMLLAPDHPSLCAFHARVESKAETAHDREVAAVELLAGIDNLHTPASVNLFLANLLKQVARNRIPRKNAIAMAYISQLLLNSISVMHRQARDAQIAAQAAKINEPVEINFDDAPRPCRRGHVTGGHEDHHDPDPSHANGSRRDNVHANGNHGNGASAVPSVGNIFANVNATNHVNALAALPNKDAQPNNDGHPACPELLAQQSEAPAVRPTPADANPIPITPTPPTTLPQHADEALCTHDDPDPSTTPRPLPAPWGTRVYGFTPVSRRRRWPSAAHHRARPNTIRHGQKQPKRLRAKVLRDSADNALGLVCVFASDARRASGGQRAMAEW